VNVWRGLARLRTLTWLLRELGRVRLSCVAAMGIGLFTLWASSIVALWITALAQKYTATAPRDLWMRFGMGVGALVLSVRARRRWREGENERNFYKARAQNQRKRNDTRDAERGR
jgi:hypothetical protein